jgi:hypothetical protein
VNQKRNAVMAGLAGVLIVAAALALVDKPAESSDANGIGRYVLAIGSYSAIAGPGLPGNDDVVLSRGGVFKIDTVTGQTWMLSERVSTGSIIAPGYDRKWVAIEQ